MKPMTSVIGTKRTSRTGGLSLTRIAMAEIMVLLARRPEVQAQGMTEVK
jgi:hypothetical protein